MAANDGGRAFGAKVQMVREYVSRNPGASKREISRDLNIDRGSVGLAILRIKENEGGGKQGLHGGDVTVPIFPPETLDAESLLDRMEQSQRVLETHNNAKHWFPVEVNVDGPIGIVFWGDPHIDSPHCDIAALREHVRLIQKAEGAWSVSIGDHHDNWVGRLTREYAKSEVSTPQVVTLIKWFVENIKPVLLLRGNHDMWTPASGCPVSWIAKGCGVPAEDWSAKFRIVFPSGREARIHAAHQFPGNSMWNPLHGPVREAKFSAWEADLLVCGHTHEEAMFERQGKWLVRVAGYKQLHDTYAKTLGYAGGAKVGQSMVAIFDPYAEDEASFLQCYSSVARGLSVLDLMRRDWKAKSKKGK